MENRKHFPTYFHQTPEIIKIKEPQTAIATTVPIIHPPYKYIHVYPNILNPFTFTMLYYHSCSHIDFHFLLIPRSVGLGAPQGRNNFSLNGMGRPSVCTVAAVVLSAVKVESMNDLLHSSDHHASKQHNKNRFSHSHNPTIFQTTKEILEYI